MRNLHFLEIFKRLRIYSMFLYPMPETPLVNAKNLRCFYLYTAGAGEGLNDHALFNLIQTNVTGTFT